MIAHDAKVVPSGTEVKWHRVDVAQASASAQADAVESLGSRIKIARERRGFGVNELDRLIGKSAGAYTSRVESGKRGVRVTPEVLCAYADALKVSVEWLARGTEATLSGTQALDAISAATPRVRAMVRLVADGYDPKYVTEWNEAIGESNRLPLSRDNVDAWAQEMLLRRLDAERERLALPPGDLSPNPLGERVRGGPRGR